MTDFLLKDIESPGQLSVLYHPRRRVPLWEKILKSIEAFHTPRAKTTRFFPDEYIKALSKITPSDSVLFFGVENLKELLILKKFINTRNISVWLWNPVATICRNYFSRRSYGKYLRRSGYNVYTFDNGDSERYGFRFTNQVYRTIAPPSRPDESEQVDLFFVGQDKGRLHQLAELKKQAHKADLKPYFHIVKSKHTPYYKDLEKFMTSQPLSYDKALEWIARSRAVVEILQPGQKGSTLRPLEALFMGRKLISNNPALRNISFYHPDNIFILGIDPIYMLGDFMARPFKKIDREIMDQYDIRNWLKQFIN